MTSFALEKIPYIIACQKNSYLRTLKATTIACQEITKWLPSPSQSEEKTASKKKKKKKKSKSSSSSTTSSTPIPKYGILMSDTILFPTGGGQPNDLGTISYQNETGITINENVLDVVRLKEDQRLVLHYVANEIPINTEVVVHVDWSRRFDHMQQHSAQHLITAVALETTGWPTTSWNLSTRVGATPCYLDLGVPLKQVTPEILSDLEAKVNEKVRNSLSMTPTIYSPEEFLALQDVRSGSKGIKSGKGPVRTVTIEGIESNTCCGTHVLHTGHLQTIKLLNVEKGPDKTSARVWFVAGDRVADHLGSLYNTSVKLTKLLTCGASEHYDRANEIVMGSKETVRQTKNLLRTMAQLMAQVRLYPTYIQDHTIVQHVEEGTADFMKQFLRMANENTSKDGEDAASGTAAATVLVSTGGGNGAGGACMMTGSAAVIDELGPALAKLFDGGARGGGKNGKYQMKINPGVLNAKIILEMSQLAKETTVRVLGL